MNIVEFLKEKKQVLKVSAVALMGAAAVYMMPAHMSSAMMRAGNDSRPVKIVQTDEESTKAAKASKSCKETSKVKKGVDDSKPVDTVQTDAKAGSQHNEENCQSSKTFVKDGVTYEISPSKRNEVSIVAIDDAIETLDIKKCIKDGDIEYTVKSLLTHSVGRTTSNVSKIILPTEGIDIGESGFCGMKKLTIIENLDKAKILSSDYLFHNCISLSEVNLPESLEVIGSSMFFNCQSLRAVTLGKNVKEDGVCNLNAKGGRLSKIGDSAFEYCENLKRIDLPESVSIEGHAFEGARELLIVNNLDKANILSSKCLFRNCIKLSEVNLPKNLNKIEESMFENCRSLHTTIIIRKDIEEIGKDAFLGCKEVESIRFEDGSKLKKIGQGAFCGCKKLKECKFPRSVSEIEDYAFVGCENLDSVSLESTVRVGLYSFPDGKMTGAEVKRDAKLEEYNKEIEDFLSRILVGEKAKGHDVNKLVGLEDIDKLFYEYTPGSTDVPNVVSKEEFEKMISDGRLMLYRGLAPWGLLSTDEKESPAKELSNRFKRGDFYYPSECQGMHCTEDFYLADVFARKCFLDKKVGIVLQLCFTSMDPRDFKMMGALELANIRDFHKYFNFEKYLEFLSQSSLHNESKFDLEVGLSGFCDYHIQPAFIGRALGCDVIYGKLFDTIKGLVCDPEIQVYNRKKLTVCEEDL